MGANTPEYRTFIACTSKLTNALKAHLIALSGDLLSGGFISQENYERLNMESWEPGRRASELVSIVRTRIDLNQQNFQKFIDILLKKPSLHRDILTILDDTYKSNGGRRDTGIHAALASVEEQDSGMSMSEVVSLPEPSSNQTISIQPEPSGPVSTIVSFSDSLSDQQFKEWLHLEGMSQPADIDKIIEVGINAKSFPYLEEDDVRTVIGNLSIGGKAILRRLWTTYRVKDVPSLSGILDQELPHSKHHMLSKFLKVIPPNDTRSLGGALGISQSKLVKMPDEELTEKLVAAWLREEDNVLSVGKPTLRTLATALKDVGQTGLANDILTGNFTL